MMRGVPGDRIRIPRLYEFLRWDFASLQARFGGVVATTFRNFPSFPQRYIGAVHGAAGGVAEA